MAESLALIGLLTKVGAYMQGTRIVELTLLSCKQISNSPILLKASVDKDGNNEKSMASRYVQPKTTALSLARSLACHRTSVREAAALIPSTARVDDMSLSGGCYCLLSQT